MSHGANYNAWRELRRLAINLDRLRAAYMKLEGVPRGNLQREVAEAWLVDLDTQIDKQIDKITAEMLLRDLATKKAEAKIAVSADLELAV